MIKRIFFILCAVFMLSNVSLAYNLTNNPNLYWIDSNSKFTLYINVKTLKYHPETDSVEFYRTEDCPSEGYFLVTKTIINYPKNTIATLTQIKYFHANDSEYIELPGSDIQEIVPGTWGESMRDISAVLAGRKEKLAEYKAQQEEQLKEQEKKKKEAEEKAESEKRRARNNRIAGAVLSGLGGLF